MSLPGSGSLSIKSSAGAGRSIATELNSSSGSLVTMASLASKSLPVHMTDFYNYSSVTYNVSLNSPTVSSNMTITNVQYQVNGGSWTSTSLPFNLPTIYPAGTTFGFKATFTNNNNAWSQATIVAHRLSGPGGPLGSVSQYVYPNSVSGYTQVVTLTGVTFSASDSGIYVDFSLQFTSAPTNVVSILFSPSSSGGNWSVDPNYPIIGTINFKANANGRTDNTCTTSSGETSVLNLNVTNSYFASYTDTSTDLSSSQYYNLSSVIVAGYPLSSGSVQSINSNNLIKISYATGCTTNTSTYVSPGGGGSGCLLAGQKVLLASGEMRNIEDLKVDDYVYTKHQYEDVFGNYRVSRIYRRPSKYWLLIKTETREIKCSISHLFMVNGIATKAFDLNVGDNLMVLQDKSFTNDPIVDITIVDEEVTVYNAEVDEAHTYITENGIYQHNVKATI